MSSNSSDNIKLSSLSALDQEFKTVVLLFEKAETEETWSKFEDSINRLIAITKGSALLHGFVGHVRKLRNVFHISLKTERTRLARVGLAFVDTLAECLGTSFEPLADLIIPLVIKLTSRANNVYVRSSHSTLTNAIKHCGLVSSIPVFVEHARNSSKTMRIACTDSLVQILTHNSSNSVAAFIEDVESAIRDGILDPESKVRELTRSLFELYKDDFSGRVDTFVDKLPDTAKKYLSLDKGGGSSKREKLGSMKKNFRQQRPHQLQNVIPAVASTLMASTQSDLLLATNSSLGASTNVSIEASPSSSPIPSNATAVMSPPSSAMNGMNRGLLEKPSRVAVVTAAPEALPNGTRPSARLQAGGVGPMRVVKPVVQEPPAKPKVRAQRVPAPPPSTNSNSVAFTEHDGERDADDAMSETSIATAAESVHNVPIRRPTSRSAATNHHGGRPVAPKRHVSSSSADHSRTEKVTKSKGSKQDTFDVASFASKTTSHDWSERERAYHSLQTYLGAQSSSSAKFCISTKLVNALLTGLSDAHFKVVHAALQALHALLAVNEDISQALVEKFLPRVANIFYVHHPALQKSSRPGIFEACESLFELIRVNSGQGRIRERKDKDINGDAHAAGVTITDSNCLLVGMVLHLLNQPDVLGNVKTRVGLFLYMNTFEDVEWTGYLSKSHNNIKTLLTKIASFGHESDSFPIVHKTILSILSRIFALQPTTLQSIYKSLPSADKSVLNKVAGGDIETDGGLLEVAVALDGARPASERKTKSARSSLRGMSQAPVAPNAENPADDRGTNLVQTHALGHLNSPSKIPKPRPTRSIVSSPSPVISRLSLRTTPLKDVSYTLASTPVPVSGQPSHDLQSEASTTPAVQFPGRATSPQNHHQMADEIVQLLSKEDVENRDVEVTFEKVLEPVVENVPVVVVKLDDLKQNANGLEATEKHLEHLGLINEELTISDPPPYHASESSTETMVMPNGDAEMEEEPVSVKTVPEAENSSFMDDHLPDKSETTKDESKTMTLLEDFGRMMVTGPQTSQGTELVKDQGLFEKEERRNVSWEMVIESISLGTDTYTYESKYRTILQLKKLLTTGLDTDTLDEKLWIQILQFLLGNTVENDESLKKTSLLQVFQMDMLLHQILDLYVKRLPSSAILDVLKLATLTPDLKVKESFRLIDTLAQRMMSCETSKDAFVYMTTCNSFLLNGLGSNDLATRRHAISIIETLAKESSFSIVKTLFGDIDSQTSFMDESCKNNTFLSHLIGQKF